LTFVGHLCSFFLFFFCFALCLVFALFTALLLVSLVSFHGSHFVFSCCCCFLCFPFKIPFFLNASFMFVFVLIGIILNFFSSLYLAVFLVDLKQAIFTWHLENPDWKCNFRFVSKIWVRSSKKLQAFLLCVPFGFNCKQKEKNEISEKSAYEKISFEKVYIFWLNIIQLYIYKTLCPNSLTNWQCFYFVSYFL